ncbi:hypothetical protein QWY84_06245 [Aquisalimonas lutea]|uniref:phenylacetate--CoA ligase family protein n=1 Tax=Aquisalimonas lutea TaxID=1327750 RepID=UPI0025B44DDF|nr:hypothetical protein [Aquisalimonas lutea]MDN3517200.1 hypothetical protein [Aquisalimonas lutea]
MRKLILNAALRVRGLRVHTHLARAKQNQNLQGPDLADHQRQRLAHVVRAGATHSDTYARTLPSATFAEDIENDPAALASHPVLDKQRLAELHPEILAYTHAHRIATIEKHTSGSTGRPLRILKDRAGVAAELAATWRAYGWLGVRLGDRGVRVWGRALSRQQQLMGRVKQAVFNTIPINAFDVTEKTLAARVRRIIHCNPRYMYGYTSAIVTLARFMTQHGISGPDNLIAIITTAEPMSPQEREAITQGFGVAPSDEYGASEVGSIAHECTAGRRHIMADHLLLEILHEDGRITPEGTGELLVSDLTNTITPVVRYRLGDFATIQLQPHCSCGLAFPVITDIHGRVEDAVVTPDDTRHHPARVCYIVDELLTGHVAVEKYQVVQTATDALEIHLVTTDSPARTTLEQRAQDAFRRHLHPRMRVSVVFRDDIPRESSGKYRLIKNSCQSPQSSRAS